ncbi:MAG: dihydroneopterin aldolase [Eubacterium sp.]
MDKITIKGLKLFAYHGVNPEEKRDGQTFILDVDYYLDITKACRTDNVEDTVSYAKVVKTVKRVFTAEKYDLIERAARVVADAILQEYPVIGRVDVELKKPEAPVNADFDYMSVSISRER